MPAEGRAIPPNLELRCVRCGYLLTGLISRVCPECGEPFDPLETYQANIKSTWEFHFEYRCSRRTYVLLALALLPAISGLVTMGILFGFGLYASVGWWVSALIVIGGLKLVLYAHDRHGPFTWVVMLYDLLACAVLSVLLG